MKTQDTPEAAATSVDDGPGVRSVALFVRMWAIAHVIHLVSANDSRLDTPWNVAVVVSALALLLRPESGRWLAILCVFQLVDLVYEMPFSPDHWILIGFVNLTILMTFTVRRSTARSGLASAFPAMRTIVLVTYTAAALAKYNTTFLDPVTSCATAIANTASYGLAEKLDVAPLWVYSVIAMETSIPILLALPATRRHWVRVAMAFHFTLSMSPSFAVVDYTATLFALFVLFLSEQDVQRILERLQWVADRSAIARDARRVPWLTALLAFGAFGILGYLSVRAAAALVLVGSELYLLAMLVVVWSAWRSSTTTRIFGRIRWRYVPVLAIAVLWTFSPYLGLRTTSVFTMFSGVRTEGEAPNHLFLPTVPLASWQEEFVVIESTSDPSLVTASDGNVGVPLLALRRMAMDDPDLVVEGVVDGDPVTFGPEPDQRDLEPLPYWQYKFLHFRPVAMTDEPFCSVS